MGTYPPRQCGIASFSYDLVRTLSELDVELTVDSVAMSDNGEYSYSSRVCHQIEESDHASYESAAHLMNGRGYDVLSVQHEYGIFGGDAGNHLMDLIRAVKMPIVTTLHTVLRNPSAAQKAVMDELLQLSERIVVMSHSAVSILADVHEISREKIDLIPHGIPHVSEAAGCTLRRDLEIPGVMILTFGLLSPDKGIQYVIGAMPRILAEIPGSVYIVVGATHPHVRSSSGETYRESLAALANELGVASSVRFVNQYVPSEVLVEYLSAMDVYVTPYLNPEQITSGTLAYSVGAGKAVISTPYTYAQELLSDGRGILVPFRHSDRIADAVLTIRANPDASRGMARRAADFGKHMRWPQVGTAYMHCFSKARRDCADRLRLLVQEPTVAEQLCSALPEPRFEHLFGLSDDTGILQHAIYDVPNRAHGYCVDDNARALLLTAYMESDSLLSPQLATLQNRYLSFVLHAHNPKTGRFRNFMDYSRRWREATGSEDSHGHALWSLGAMIGRCRDKGRREAARSIFDLGIAGMADTTSLRTWAYGVLAADEVLRTIAGDRHVEAMRNEMGERIWDQYRLARREDWAWFESGLTYANARLPQALMIAGKALQREEMIEAGTEALEWLMTQQTDPVARVFAPIGTNGFYIRGGRRAAFDQQPVEAWCSVSACLCAHRVTGHAKWMGEARRAFAWFVGANVLRLPVCDETRGACHDGLHENRLNGNQGAESTLSYLCALVEMRGATVSERCLQVRTGDEHGK